MVSLLRFSNKSWSTFSGRGSNANLVFRAFTWYFSLLDGFLVPLGFPPVLDGTSVVRRWEEGGISKHWATWYLSVGQESLQTTGTKSTFWTRHMWPYPLCQAPWPPSLSLGKGSLLLSREWESLPWPLVSGVPDQFSLARATRLTWCYRQDSHLILGKEWAHLNHLLLLGRSYKKPHHYSFSPLLGSLTSPPSSFHFSEFSFGCLLLLPELIVILSGEEQGELKLMIHAEHIVQCIVHRGKVQ